MASSDPPHRSSRLPGGLNTQLVTAIVLALGIGGGGGSFIANSRGDEPSMQALLAERKADAQATYASKIEMQELKGELALISQQLVTVNQQLEAVSLQLTEMEQRPLPRRR